MPKFLVTFPIFQNQKVLGFNPSSPVVKIRAFTAQSPVSILGWWTKILQKRKRSPTREVPFMLAEYLWNLRGDALVFCTFLRQTWAPRKNQSSEDNECPPSSNSNNTCYHLLRTYYVPGTILSILFMLFHLSPPALGGRCNYPPSTEKKTSSQKDDVLCMSTELLSDTAKIWAQAFWLPCAVSPLLHFQWQLEMTRYHCI